jgi:nucleoside-diphosphate-sugar epimerase
MLLTASPKAKGEAVNVGNTKEAAILKLAEKVKEAAKCNQP